MNKKINKNKLYSIKEAMEFFPWINNHVTFQKYLREDMEYNNSKEYGAIIIKRNKYRKYYLKGENIIKTLKEKK